MTMNCFNKRESLKKRIKTKFKTLKHFSNSTGYPYKDLNNFFAGRISQTAVDETFNTINELLSKTKPVPDTTIITGSEREMIRIKIAVNYKNVTRFIEKNPGFTKTFISNVINGRRMRVDGRFQRLQKIVNKLSTHLN